MAEEILVDRSVFSNQPPSEVMEGLIEKIVHGWHLNEDELQWLRDIAAQVPVNKLLAASKPIC